MALAVILLLSRLILNASNAQTLPGWNVGCRADTVRVEQDSAFGFLCHWSRADVGQSVRDSVLSAAATALAVAQSSTGGNGVCGAPRRRCGALGSWRWRDVARGDPMLYRIGAAEGGVSSNDELRARAPGPLRLRRRC